MLIVLALTVLAACPAVAVTVDSSYGWATGYEAEHTVSGAYGNSDMGRATSPNSWIIYDFGTATSVRKVRVTPPMYGGTPSQTFNPPVGTLEYSNDKLTWTAPIAYSAPPLESVVRTDFAECALPQEMNYRYVRLTLPNASGNDRIGEIWFLSSTQLACWEMNQDATYSGMYPAWQTVDGDPNTFGVVSGDSGGLGQPHVTYDIGVHRMVYGFTMQARPTWANDTAPHAGQLWASDSPTAGFEKVGDWTASVWANGETKTFDFGVANAKLGRYVQLRSATAGTIHGQWAEFTLLSNAATESLSIGATKMQPDGTSVQCTGVVIAAFTGRFYVEAEDRSSGIRVDMASYSVSRGQLATVTGIVTTDADTGERYVTGQQATGAPGRTIFPVGVSNKTLVGL